MAPPPIRSTPRYPVSWRARQHIRKADLRRDLEEIFYVLESGAVVVPSVNYLQSLSTTSYVEGATPVVVTGVGTFQWDPLSVTAHDGIYVVRPTGVTGAGRWVRPFPAVLTGVSSPGTRLFALADHTHAVNIAEASVPDLATLALVTEGSLVWVVTLKCYFHLDSSSVLTPDGITLVTATGGGNWERLVSTTSFEWLYQATWYIDPVGGNDENTGASSGLSLATFEELSRRLSTGGIQQDTQVYVAYGTLASAKLEVDTNNHILTLEGVAQTVRTGIVTTYTERTHMGASGGEVSLLTDAGIADWTADVWQRVRITSGASANAIAWVAGADPGGAGLSVAATNRFGAVPVAALFIPTMVVPASGSAYTIENLPSIQRLSIKQRQSVSSEVVANLAAIIVKNLYIGGILGTRLNIALDPECSIVFDGCVIDAWVYIASARPIQFTRCRGGGVGNATTWGSSGAPTNWRDCLFVVKFAIQDAFNFNFYRSLSYGVTGTSGAFSQSSVSLGLRMEAKFADSQIANTALGINFVLAGDIWTSLGLSGPRNTIGILIGDSSDECLGDHHFFWSDSTDIPNLSGSTTPIRIAGDFSIDLTWANMPYRSDEQRGKATLAAGTVIVTARNALRRGVYISRNTPGGTPGEISAPDASRTNTQFVINSANALDTSTVDWIIPGNARGDVMCEGSLNSL